MSASGHFGVCSKCPESGYQSKHTTTEPYLFVLFYRLRAKHHFFRSNVVYTLINHAFGANQSVLEFIYIIIVNKQYIILHDNKIYKQLLVERERDFD